MVRVVDRPRLKALKERPPKKQPPLRRRYTPGNILDDYVANFWRPKLDGNGHSLAGPFRQN